MSGLSRLIRHFDFEEAEVARFEFPRYFKRNVAEDRGFPPFGAMRLSREHAADGRWSFEMELGGGSLSAEIPTGILPILPLADYGVTVQVRTEDLVRAGACLVARLHDARGEPIPGATVETTPIRSSGRWTTLAVRLPGGSQAATDLVVELQVRQPTPDPYDVTDPLQLEDVSGRVWFDDLRVWHLPRIELSTQTQQNILVQPETPELRIRIKDVAADALMTHVDVIDVHGHLVHEMTFPAPRTRAPVHFALPIEDAGWYRVELTLQGAKSTSGRATLDFLLLPPPRSSPTTPLDVALSAPHDPVILAELPAMIETLGVRSVQLGIWDQRLSIDAIDARHPALQRMIEALMRRNIEVHFTLDGVPRRLASDAGVNPSQVIELFQVPAEVWRTYLDQLLMAFGLHIRHWQLGETGRIDAFYKSNLAGLVDNARDRLGEFVPDPIVIIPFDVDQDLPPLAGHGVNVRVPYEIPPDALADLMTSWPSDRRYTALHFETLPPTYTPRQRTLDLALRTLHAWRYDVSAMSIDAPWSRNEDGVHMLTPEFAAWRGLADRLRGRRFAGEIMLAPDVTAWLMEGYRGVEDALVVWAPQRATDAPRTAQVMIAEGDVTEVDLFGNRRARPADALGTSIDVVDMPTFIEGVDVDLARFRAGFTFEPNELATEHRAQDAVIVLENPWGFGISGSIRLGDIPGLRMDPRRHEFSIPERGRVELPVRIVVDRSAVAGARTVSADVRLTVDREIRMQVFAPLETGWRDVEWDASWTLAENVETGARDLVVVQSITNVGTTTLLVDAFVMAPGVRQNRSPLAPLPPQVTATRTFRIADAASLSNTTLRLGITEREGLRQLNHHLQLPDLSAFAQRAVSAE